VAFSRGEVRVGWELQSPCVPEWPEIGKKREGMVNYPVFLSGLG